MATAAARTFAFELQTDITIPDDLSTSPTRPNTLIDEFFVPGLAKVMADDKAEASLFFPLAFFQAASDDWAARNGKPKKELKISDARQKLSDGFKKFQEKNTKAGVLEMLMANRSGKEGDEKATEPGVRAWLRLKKK